MKKYTGKKEQQHRTRRQIVACQFLCFFVAIVVWWCALGVHFFGYFNVSLIHQYIQSKAISQVEAAYCTKVLEYNDDVCVVRTNFPPYLIAAIVLRSNENVWFQSAPVMMTTTRCSQQYSISF